MEIETRKLQLIGGSSYMVSLPKDWVKANGLKQGDEIVLEIEDSVITLYPKGFKEDIKISKVEITDLKRYDEKFLKRFLYALYIQGIDEIVIKDKKVTPKLIAKISEIVKSIIGIEIIDTRDKIVLRCLTITDFDVYGVVKRMSQIVQTIIETIIDAIVKRDYSFLSELKNLEEDTDRLYLLAVRQEHRLVREFSSPAKWNELRLILGIRTVAKLIEEIIDNLEDFSKLLAKMNEVELELSKQFLMELNNAFELVSKAYFESNVELSEDSIQLLEDLENRIIDKMKTSPQMSIYLLSICRHIKSIGEIALNKSVRESLEEIKEKEQKA
ncbi:MAG: phosphate uptake regulator PhoU [Archaeoglobus sp.]|jgi:phosphate uptake regulator|nr:phosphate uptake regulator PhoU [Archaeoglobus sp.]